MSAIKYFYAGDAPHMRRADDWRGTYIRRYTGFSVVFRRVPLWAVPLALMGGIIDAILGHVSAGVHYGEPGPDRLPSDSETEPENTP